MHKHEDRWLFVLLQYRGLLDVIAFGIVLHRIWQGKDDFFSENLFGGLCDHQQSENTHGFCRKFVKYATTARLAAALCLTIGAFFVSTK